MRKTYVDCHSLDLPSPTEARASRRREEGIQDLRKRLWIPRRSLPRAFPPHADPPVAETWGGNDRPEK